MLDISPRTLIETLLRASKPADIVIKVSTKFSRCKSTKITAPLLISSFRLREAGSRLPFLENIIVVF